MPLPLTDFDDITIFDRDNDEANFTYLKPNPEESEIVASVECSSHHGDSIAVYLTLNDIKRIRKFLKRIQRSVQ